MGAGSANCKVVARPPGRVWAQTPVAVKRGGPQGRGGGGWGPLCVVGQCGVGGGGGGVGGLVNWRVPGAVERQKLGVDCRVPSKGWVGLRDRRVRGWSADEGGASHV